MTPRLLRMRDAPAYLGMCEREFNATVRPNVREVRIGQQGVAFDRNDLDAWADEYVSRHSVDKDGSRAEHVVRSGRRGSAGDKPWQQGKVSPASLNVEGSGTSTRSSGADAFAKALAQARGKKPKST